MTKDVDLVIVTYNSQSFVHRLASSMRAIPRIAKVVVVDNSPSDATMHAVRAVAWGHPLETLRRIDNPGFGAAVNLGVARGSSPFIALVNPDVLVGRNEVDHLVEVLQRNPAAAVVGSRLVTSDGAPVSSARHFPTLASIVMRRPEDVAHGDRQVPADWVCGALMVWRRADFEDIGGFDERYFLYYEDVDICRRTRQAGRSVMVAGDLTVIHDQGHGAETSEYLRKVSRRSRRVYARKWLGWRGSVAACIADLIDLSKATLRKTLR